MKRIFGIYLLLLSFILASAGSAMALTAANTQIINNATLQYNDGSGLKTATATVTVNVALVPSGPTVTPGPAMSTPYAGPGTTLTNTFYVTATSNGPDTYTVTTAITASTNTSGPTATVQTGSTTISVGATVTVTGSTATDIVVPADGTSNSSVNGIIAGSTVVINGEAHQVSSVTDNATGTSHIILATALSGAPAAGVLVAERKTVLVDVTAGTITTPGTSITVTKNATATSNTSPGPSGTSSAGVTDTFTSGTATLAKYVRNVTTPAAGTGTAYTYNSTSYYPSGITAKPTETLEYILVATNSGSGQVTAAVVTDVLPTAFVSPPKPNAYGAGKEVTYVSDTNAVSTYSAAADTDEATYNAGTLTVNVGTGATSSAGGSIPGNNSRVLVLYQVTVNN